MNRNFQVVRGGWVQRLFFMLVRVSAPFELGQSIAPVHKSNSLSKLNQLPSSETVEKLLERCNEKPGCCKDICHICQPVPIAVKARRLIRLIRLSVQ